MEYLFIFSYHSVQLPQTKLTEWFQPKTATGKLNAVMIPTTPKGFHCSSNQWPGPIINQLIITLILILITFWWHNFTTNHTRQTNSKITHVNILLNLANSLWINFTNFKWQLYITNNLMVKIIKHDKPVFQANLIFFLIHLQLDVWCHLV